MRILCKTQKHFNFADILPIGNIANFDTICTPGPEFLDWSSLLLRCRKEVSISIVRTTSSVRKTVRQWNNHMKTEFPIEQRKWKCPKVMKTDSQINTQISHFLQIHNHYVVKNLLSKGRWLRAMSLEYILFCHIMIVL